jgi:hypothetical protein
MGSKGSFYRHHWIGDRSGSYKLLLFVYCVYFVGITAGFRLTVPSGVQRLR